MKQDRSFIVDILFVLALFGVFAISAFVLITIGADVYQHTVQDMTVNYETRTAASYITEKVRQNDASVPGEEASISVDELEGIPALKLAQSYNDMTYYTYLYLHDGYLRELFIQQYADLGGSALDAGTNIMPLKDFDVKQDSSGLLTITVEPSHGDSYQFFVASHCGNN